MTQTCDSYRFKPCDANPCLAEKHYTELEVLEYLQSIKNTGAVAYVSRDGLKTTYQWGDILKSYELVWTLLRRLEYQLEDQGHDVDLVITGLLEQAQSEQEDDTLARANESHRGF